MGPFFICIYLCIIHISIYFLLYTLSNFHFIYFYINFLLLLFSICVTGGSNGNNTTNSFSYQFHGDPRATFAQFFGSSNPFASFFDMSDNLFEKNVFDSLDTDTDFFSPFGGLGARHGLGGAFRYSISKLNYMI